MRTHLIFIHIAAMLIYLTPFVTMADLQSLEASIAGLETKYHIRIHYQYDPSTFFPSSWLSSSANMAALPIHEQDVESLIPTLEQFLSAHPPAVIEDNLEHIYLLGRLCFERREYGGTHTSKSMYIVWDRARKYSKEFILERFHSEFSSILRDYHEFPVSTWTQVNPDGFEYTGTGFEMLGDPLIYESTAQEQSNGFLLKYSMSSQENDFNMIASWLFTKPEELDSVAQHNDKIRRKLEITKGFYQSVSAQYPFN